MTVIYDCLNFEGKTCRKGTEDDECLKCKKYAPFMRANEIETMIMKDGIKDFLDFTKALKRQKRP